MPSTLNKDQALAAMDAHIIRAEAEQSRRLNSRVQRITVMFPSLRSLPAQEREAVVAEARVLAFKHWMFYAILAVTLAGVGLLLAFHEQLTDSGAISALYGLLLIHAAFLNTSLYLHQRSWVKRVVQARAEFRAG